jgi:polyisoprenyl-phosphate glycosyltransferase
MTPVVLSIVIPVYFNQETLAELHRQLSRLVETLHVPAEYIFVDDYSGDHSFQVLKTLAAADPRVRVVRLARNFGSSAAILAGLSYATGSAAAFVSADLQDPPHLLIDMMQAWQSGHKIVFAVRNTRGDPLSSRIFANIFNWLFHRLVLQDVPPSGIGFFLIDRQIVELVLQCEEKNAHLINLIAWLGFHPHVVRYDRPARQHGSSRWTFLKKLKYAIDAVVAFSYLPIRLVSLAGILISMLGALAAIYVILIRLILRFDAGGWASLMVAVLVLSGTQMTMLGVLGEYLWRTLDQTRKRPIFVVDTVLRGPEPDPHAHTASGPHGQ